MAADETRQFPSSDHDLLVRLDTQMGRVLDDIAILNKNINGYVRELQITKLDKDQYQKDQKEHEKLHDDTERRLRRIEKYVWVAIGALTLLEFVYMLLHHA
jgi:hypothetical protein